jgi:hypothetical protein
VILRIIPGIVEDVHGSEGNGNGVLSAGFFIIGLPSANLMNVALHCV